MAEFDLDEFVKKYSYLLPEEDGEDVDVATEELESEEPKPITPEEESVDSDSVLDDFVSKYGYILEGETKPPVGGDDYLARQAQYLMSRPSLDEQVPIEPTPEGDGIFRQALDIPLNIKIGVVQGVKFMTDIFGAENPVSQALESYGSVFSELLSAEAKQDQETIARILKDAEDEGILGQIAAGLQAFTVSPLDMTAQAAGTMVPILAAGLVGKVARLGVTGVRALQAAAGGGMGVGIVKSEIYEGVYEYMLSQGVDEEEAKRTAAQAQAYNGKNLDSILIGGGLGVLSASFGAERIISGIMMKAGGQPTGGLVKRVITAGFTEAIPETAQGFQEKLASNLAQVREGADISITRGAFANAALEGAAGFAVGGPLGVFKAPMTPQEVAGLAQENQQAAKASEDVTPATSNAVEKQAEKITIEATVTPRREGETDEQWRARIERERAETPEQRVARLQEEAAEGADIDLEEEGEGGVEPTVPTTPPVTPTPEGAVAPVEPVVEPVVAEPPPAAEVPTELEPLRRVARAEQAPEDVPSLVEAGLVEVYKDQPVLTDAGLAALPEAERPRLTPEARKIQIDTGSNEVVAEAISKNLRIGVDQVGPNVTLPAGWTLDGDIYVPPEKQIVFKVEEEPTPNLATKETAPTVEQFKETKSDYWVPEVTKKEFDVDKRTGKSIDVQKLWEQVKEKRPQPIKLTKEYIENNIEFRDLNEESLAKANVSHLGLATFEINPQDPRKTVGVRLVDGWHRAKKALDEGKDFWVYPVEAENSTIENAYAWGEKYNGLPQVAPSPAPEVRESRREQPVVLKNRFYSQLERTVAAKMPNVSSPEQLKAIIDPTRGSGVKPEEIKWSGITEAIDRIAAENNGRVPKEAIIKYMQDEGNVRFEEVTLARKKVPYSGGEIKRMPNGTYKLSFFGYDSMYTNLEDAESDLQKMREGATRTEDDTRYSQYQLPNGENYREVVLTIPSESSEELSQKARDLSRERRGIQESGRMLTREESNRITEIDEEIRNLEDRVEQAKSKYKSPHFANIPNYIAHMRLNDRKDAEGKDGAFIEEIQSDLHQKAREVGYKDENIVQQNFVSWLAANNKDLSEQEIQTQFKTKIGEEIQQWTKDQEIAAKNASAMPDTPFRKDWPLQMFKRALEEAVASGKDWIGWTTGDMQAARYDLSKQAKAVIYNKNQNGSFAITVRDLNDVNSKIGDYSAEKLPDVVGKELAEKIINDPNPNGIFAGNDLKVGGEGMKGFYDNILPKEIAKYVKKWGATVEKSKLSDPDEAMTYEGLAAEGLTMREFNALPRDRAEALRKKYTTGTPIWRVNITPEMRRIIEEEGQSLFSLQMPSRIAGMEPEAVATKVESLGFVRGGIVSVVNEPNATFEGRTIIRDGKVVGIELNAAALKDDAAIERVLNHEIAESANADGALNNLVAGLTPKERKEINNAITRLGYAERARTAEEAARAVELLAEGWRGRKWFERAVARIEAWANKLGYKLTRRAAEYIAARNVSEINEEFKQAYNNFIDVSGEPREARVGAQAVVDADMGRRSQTELTPQEIEQLESGEKIRVYRAMQVIDGKLYPPMSALVGGKLRKPTEIGTWEKAEERPDLLDKKGKFVLQKGNKATVPAAYNPYFHTSSSPLNDQFSSAYKRDNLVTVEVEVPASELTSGYKAEGAKDAVGEVRWNAGPVSSKLPADKKRKVILSRYAKVLRIVPDSEVAGIISNLLEGTNLSIPENTVTPSLKAELEKKGITVSPRPARGEEIRESRREDAIPTFSEGSPEASTLSTMAASMVKVDAASEGKPNPENKPTYKISEIASVWMDQGGDTRQLQDLISENTLLSPANAQKVANAIAKQYGIQQEIALAATPEVLPETVTPEAEDRRRPKTTIQRVLDAITGVRVPPVKITVNERTALKDQIKLKAAAYRDAKKAQQETAAEMVEAIKEMDIRGPIRPKQVAALMKRAVNVNFASETSVDKFIDYAAKVIENANYDRDVSEAKAAQKRAKEIAKRKNVAGPQKQVLNDIAKIDIRHLNDPREFAEAANYYMRAFKTPISEGYQVVPDEEMNEYLDKKQEETKQGIIDADQANRERLAEKYSVPIEAVNDILDAEDTQAALVKYAKREGVEGMINEKVRDGLAALQRYDTTGMTMKQQELVSKILDLDVDGISTENRIQLIRDIDNILVNGQTNGVQRFVAAAEGQSNAFKAAKNKTFTNQQRAWINILFGQTFGKKTKGIGAEDQKQMALSLQSIADTFRNIFGKKSLGLISQIMGFGDLLTGNKKFQTEMRLATEETSEFLTGVEKKFGVKAVADNEGRTAEGVVSYLIQQFPLKTEEESIITRRSVITQDINQKRKTGDSESIAEADMVASILERIDGDTTQEILNNLKREFPANYEILVWYKDTFLPKYKNFLKEFDENFNNQANNYENPNYLPVSYMFAKAAELSPEEQAKYYNLVSLTPKQAANSVKRLDYENIPKNKNGIPAAISYNLRNTVYASLSDQLKKAYTSAAWAQIQSFVNSKAAIDVFGNEANREFMAKRLELLKDSQDRRGYESDGFSKVLDGVAIFLRRIGIGIGLGGVGQTLKQAPDQILTTIANTGDPELTFRNLRVMMFTKDQRADAMKLMSGFSIAERGDAAMGGTQFTNPLESGFSNIEKFIRGGNWARVKETARKISDVWLIALKKSDFWAASSGWLTYYQKKLEEEGGTFTDFATEAELVKTDPIRQRAAYHAELMIDIYQGSSDPTRMARLSQRGKTGYENAWKGLFLAFNSFVLQQRVRTHSDLGESMSKQADPESAKLARRGLAGTFAGILMFHMMRRYAIPAISGLGAYGVYAMLGIDPEEPDEEKKKEDAAFRLKRFYSEVAGNVLVGGFGSAVEQGTLNALNQGAYMLSRIINDEWVMDDNGDVMEYSKWKKDRAPFWYYESYKGGTDLGIFGIGFDQLANAQEAVKKATDPELRESLTPEEQRLVSMVAFSEILFLARLNDADVNRMFSRMGKETVREAQEREAAIRKIRTGR